MSGNSPKKILSASSLCLLVIALFWVCLQISSAYEVGAPIPPEEFGDDYYKVYGTPNLTLSLERSNVDQGEATSLFMTLTNRGRITSFKVNEEPGANKREEILAAEREQELEKLRTTAQDVSVEIVAENKSAIDIKRAVAFPGNIREGQTSGRLEFSHRGFIKIPSPDSTNFMLWSTIPTSGMWRWRADEDHPESPDVFYWYDTLSQTIPVTLKVERKSSAQFAVLNISPAALWAGSKDNIVKITIKNVGCDNARDLVARLRPESGLYVSVDESPIPALVPGSEAELVYKLDVSKDAVPGKRYQLKILFAVLGQLPGRPHRFRERLYFHWAAKLWSILGGRPADSYHFGGVFVVLKKRGKIWGLAHGFR